MKRLIPIPVLALLPALVAWLCPCATPPSVATSFAEVEACCCSDGETQAVNEGETACHSAPADASESDVGCCGTIDESCCGCVRDEPAPMPVRTPRQVPNSETPKASPEVATLVWLSFGHESKARHGLAMPRVVLAQHRRLAFLCVRTT